MLGRSAPALARKPHDSKARSPRRAPSSAIRALSSAHRPPWWSRSAGVSPSSKPRSISSAHKSPASDDGSWIGWTRAPACGCTGFRRGPMIHTLRAFRHPNFRLFFYGQSVSVLGTWIQQVAMIWLVYRMSASPFLLGLTAFASQFPILLFAPLGGIWADRLDRRKLLLATQVLASVQAFALAALVYTGLIAVWHLIIMAAVLGVIIALDTPIRQSFVPEMVPSKQDMPSAIATNGFIQNAGRMLGPSIAGVLIAVSGEAFCFLLNGVSKLAVIAAVAMMQIDAARRRAAAAAIRGGL